MPDGRIVINGRVWQGVTRLEIKNEVVMLPLDMVEKLGAHTNWEFYPRRPAFEPNDDEIMVPVSLLCRYLDLDWAYLPDINTLILTREEPALRGKRIVLDAGHGGVDTGATRGNLVESELNWDIVKRLADVLQLSGALIEYTRQSGEQATLSQRLAKVNDLQPDLFVSVHHNSFLDGQLNGTETYWYGNWGARHLAQYIQTHVLEELGTINRGVREAAFCLLRYIAATPVLIKVGFITGQEDSAVVASPWMRERAALGIFRGVREYIEENPPQM
ncbi:MAG: N-acetylmuramoyl-L-alanine amidase [Firmicutes bacterium]|nr:N-acetylmuramoyl-L-alanine amidase [Bacillota bacterium]